MPDKVVFLGDGRTVLRLPIGTESPEGSATFFSPEQMSILLDRRSMDSARKSLLGSPVESRDADDSARLLWETIMELVPGVGSELPRKLERAKDAFGNNKNIDRSPHELIGLAYVQGADSMRDFFYKKLSKQEKAIIQIFAENGRGIWTKDQADQLIMDNAGKLKTTQDPLKVYNYYRGSLLEKKFLRRVTFEEFSKKYPGVSLI